MIWKDLMKLGYVFSRVKEKCNKYLCRYYESKLGYCSPTSFIEIPLVVGYLPKIYLYENSYILSGAKFIISSYGEKGKLILKKNVAVSNGFTVVTGNHHRSKGKTIIDNIREYVTDKNVDIVIEEDVWIGANVTLLPGTHIGRGVDVGAGSVVRSVIPPYAVVAGNPAKIIGFNMTPEEIVEHEKLLYNEGERLSYEMLKKNYERHYTRRIPEIIKTIRT